MTVKKLKVQMLGEKCALVERLMIPLDGTVQILEQIFKDRKVVFLRAGASGKSSLAQCLCAKQPQVFASPCFLAFCVSL